MEEKNKTQDENLDLDLEKFDFDEEDDFEDEYEFTPKKRPNKIIIGIASAIVLIIAVWFFFFRGNTLTPDMTNWSRFEVDNWGSTNEVEINYLYEYSEVPENFVIEQSVPFGTKVKNGLQITVTLSEGLDPNEYIDVIDIQNATNAEIETWIDQHGLQNVELKYTYNPLVPENHVVSYEFETGSESNFKRKDSLTIEISRGATSNDDKITLPNLVEMSLNQALAWGENNGITINTDFTFSEYTLVDQIISQDIEEGAKVSTSDIINLKVSKGPQIIVPDFSDFTASRVSAWALDKGVEVSIIEKYSAQIEDGFFIEQNLVENEIISIKDSIEVTFSLGKIDIYSYVGQPILTMKEALDELNLQGANISYSIEYFYTPYVAEGMIINHSYKYSEMSPGAIMTIEVSLGESVFVPDFGGMTKDLILDTCQTEGLICTFQFKHYPSPEGWVISQSYEEGEIISKNDPVIITLSLGPN